MCSILQKYNKSVKFSPTNTWNVPGTKDIYNFSPLEVDDAKEVLTGFKKSGSNTYSRNL